jgi:RPA family protein
MKKIFYSMLMLAMAAMTFTSCEDVPEPYAWPTPSDEEEEEVVVTPTGSGTVDDPYNVAAAQALIQTLGADVQSDEIYVKGFISQIDEVSEQYGNATYWISDTKGSTAGQLEIYRGYSLGGEKFASANEIKEGDEVIVKGKVVNFRGNTPEFTTGSSLYSLNGQTASEKPVSETLGTLDEPITVSKAVELINALEDGGTTEQDAYIKGKITTIKTTDENIAKYKNIDYIISDGTQELTVFRGKNLDNTDFTEAGQINVGDEVVVLGKLTKYVNSNTGAVVPEVAQGNYIVKLTKGSTPGTDIKSLTVAEFNAASESNDVWYQLTGTVKNLKDNDQYGNFDLEDETGSVYVYGLLSEKGGEKKKFQELAAAKGIKEGSKITIIGTRGSYNGKIEVMNAYFVSIDDGSGTSGGNESGTLAKPFTPAEANAFVSKMEAGVNSDKDYYIKGKIIEIKDNNQFSTQYGNCTFYISDDGTDKDDKFYVYRTLYLGNKKYADDSWPKPKAGDEVIICGKVVNYKGNTPETVQNQSYIYSLNGSTNSRRH